MKDENFPWKIAWPTNRENTTANYLTDQKKLIINFKPIQAKIFRFIYNWFSFFLLFEFWLRAYLSLFFIQ